MRNGVTSVAGSLKLLDWPRPDQIAWAQAIRPKGRLTRGGSAAHLKPVTRDDLAYRYGQFLDHVRRTDSTVTSQVAGAVTRERVACYVLELKSRVASVTVQGSIAKLHRATQLLDPSRDLDWLRELSNDLALEMIPASKLNRVVDSYRIIEAGLTLMDEADTASIMSPRQRAQQYRNGLMIALLALCPIRLRNFASLDLDRNIRRVGGQWCISLSAGETKEGRPDERPVQSFLTRYIDCYRANYRATPNYGGSDLWVSRSGRPLGYSGVERIVSQTTRSTLGVSISPHLFRTCCASTAYKHTGEMMHLASALLNHRGMGTTEDHYNRANCAHYSRKFAKLLEPTGTKPPDRGTSPS